VGLLPSGSWIALIVGIAENHEQPTNQRDSRVVRAIRRLFMASLDALRMSAVMVRMRIQFRKAQIRALRTNSFGIPGLRVQVMTNIQIGAIFGIIILEIVGFALLPTVYSSIKSANSTGQITGSSATVANLVPLIYILVLFAAPVIVLVAVFS
jgi:hypothetical protein